MIENNDRKSIAKSKLHTAIENFKQAELEGAQELAPVTYRWAKVKIYNDKKIILNPRSHSNTLEDAADDASAAAAQLLSIVRKKETNENTPVIEVELTETGPIENLMNEGGLPI
ncbi:MAG: hypothetical protein Q7U04_09985 [Bacteriovorax sp.]|nr:hypothetical protein [Bacteriovorax sp.]